MPKLGLRPFSVITEGAEAYFGYNFMRLENVHEHMEDVRTGLISITGQGDVNTGLATVEGAMAGFVTNPSAGAAFIVCFPAGAGQITIRVLTNTFAVSVTAVSIRWIAVGELVLS